MMRIHTTQNLSSLGTTNQSTNVVSVKNFRFNSTEKDENQQPYVSSPSFKGKKPNKDALNKFTKKVVLEAKKIVGDISKNAVDDKKWGDKFLDSGFFDWILGIADHETLVQAIISCVICMAFRPLTIMAISNDKSKQDNAYAASHAMASGATGLVSTLIIANPFKKGEGYAMKNLLQNFKESTLKKFYPHLDIASITKGDGTRKAVEEWLDKSGNKFIKDLKDVSKIPVFKDFASVSEETYKSFGADVDWAAMKGKSFNDVVTKDGKSLYDVLDWKKIGIKVNDKGSDGPISLLCKNIDRGFMESLIKDAEEGSAWKKLDINSVYGKDNLVKDFREWKEIGTGKQWKLDLDSAYISSAIESADYIPEISGKVRKASKHTGENKFACYLKNGKDDRLGTEVTQEMHDADATTDVQKKILTWLPDILTRPLVATGTIALIPWMLKNVLHIEKGSNAKNNQQQVAKSNVEKDENSQKNDKEVQTNEPSFKGKGRKEGNIFRRLFNKLYGEIYGKNMYESENVRAVAARLSKTFGEKMTQHFSTLGALVTSSVYVSQTLKKKELDKDRRKTLAINQGLCFITPTICAYLVDHLLNDFTKKIEYRYAGRREQQMAALRATGKAVDAKKAEEITKKLSGKLKGVRIFSGLVTFTLIYRYLTPVLITPLANKISDFAQNRKKARMEAQENDAQNVKLALS